MDAAPKQIMHSYLDRALQHFVELLSPARRSSTVSAHSTSSMLKVSQHLLSCCSVQLAWHHNTLFLTVEFSGLVQSHHLTLSHALAFNACHFSFYISVTTGLFKLRAAAGSTPAKLLCLILQAAQHRGHGKHRTKCDILWPLRMNHQPSTYLSSALLRS